eukprot:Pgem_evm1s5507
MNYQNCSISFYMNQKSDFFARRRFQIKMKHLENITVNNLKNNPLIQQQQRQYEAQQQQSMKEREFYNTVCLNDNENQHLNEKVKIYMEKVANTNKL